MALGEESNSGIPATMLVSPANNFGGCCFNISVENTSEGATPTDVAPAILVQNANLTVTRIA